MFTGPQNAHSTDFYNLRFRWRVIKNAKTPRWARGLFSDACSSRERTLESASHGPRGLLPRGDAAHGGAVSAGRAGGTHRIPRPARTPPRHVPEPRYVVRATLLSLSASAPKAARDAPDAAAAGAAALAPALAQYSPPRVRAQTRRGAAPLPAAPARLPDPGARRLRQLHRAAACAWHQR